MSIYKRQSTWRAEVFIQGKRIARKGGFRKKADAQRWKDLTTQAFLQKPSEFEQCKFKLQELIARFQEIHLQYVKPSTRDRYMVDIDHRITPYFQNIALDNIDSLLLESFKSSLVPKLAPKSLNNCIHTVRLLLNKAVKWKMLSKSPYSLDSIKVSRVSSKMLWWDKRSYIEKFLVEAKRRSRYYAAFLLAIETGMRLGEVVGLSKQDVDFENGRIHVWRQWSDVYRKYGSCKNGLDRWVDFNPRGELADALRKSMLKSGDKEMIFVTATGKRVTNRALASRYFKHICRQAKVPEISFHGMRHTFASWYMIEVDEIWALKSILGHSDIRTTQRYAHHSQGSKRKVLEFSQKFSPHFPPAGDSGKAKSVVVQGF